MVGKKNLTRPQAQPETRATTENLHHLAVS